MQNIDRIYNLDFQSNTANLLFGNVWLILAISDTPNPIIRPFIIINRLYGRAKVSASQWWQSVRGEDY